MKKSILRNSIALAVAGVFGDELRIFRQGVVNIDIENL